MVRWPLHVLIDHSLDQILDRQTYNPNVVRQVNMASAWLVSPFNRHLIREGAFSSQPNLAMHQLLSALVQANLSSDW